jgi:hypothetical protein
VSSTTGLRAGDALHEVNRLRQLLDRHRRRSRWLESSRDYWRTRARAAEHALNRPKGAKP